MIDIKAPRAQMVSSLTKIAGVAGFIALLGIGMWGSIAIAKNAPGVFSSLAAAIASLTSVFVPAGEKIVISVPSLTVNAGETFQISWDHEKKSAEGSYTFRYDCADGVYFTSPSPTGGATTVYCNVPFNFLNIDNSITLSVYSTKNHFIDVTVHIDFTANGASASAVSGDSLLTIANDKLGSSPAVVTPTSTPEVPTTPPSAPNPTTPKTPGPTTTTTYPLTQGSTTPVSNPNGFVDLSVRVIEQGVVNKSTGVFTASTSPSRVDIQSRVAVRFAVENLGTKTSREWSFNAVLPTVPSNIFSSPTQPVLAPGDRIEFTLSFDQVADANTGTLTINVDPTGSINESSKANNIIHYTVTTHK